MHQSTATREIVLQFLYTCEITKTNIFSAGFWQQFLKQFLIHKVSKRKARLYIKTIFDHQSEIDDLITLHLGKNWTIDRIHKVDLNILRMFVAEILIFKNPPRVVLNETVNLAKKYSDDTSRKFINGLADRLLNNELSAIVA